MRWRIVREGDYSDEGGCRSETVRGKYEMPGGGAGSVRGARRRQEPSVDRESARAHARQAQARGAIVSPTGNYGRRRLDDSMLATGQNAGSRQNSRNRGDTF